MKYFPSHLRYDMLPYNRCGKSGLKLPGVSLGLWHNFGDVDDFKTSRALLRRAFDLGITHFDLANNYGPPPGSAERTFGRIFQKDFRPFRDELILSSKAGYTMWPGPYGDWGSRKYLVASLDQSLKRMGVDYVDIFYHHRPDPETPLEETMSALDYIVRSGRAMYVGISNYQPAQTQQAARMLRALGTPCLIHQASYNMFNRWVEAELLDVLAQEGIGCIAFSPLAQGLLTEKYLKGIPKGSRASKPHGFLKPAGITEAKMKMVARLNNLAESRGQTLAQFALAWILRQSGITSVLIGASRMEQINEAVLMTRQTRLSDEEIQKIEEILRG
jgi:L-glyceraldehyde 3-phosphate reductase